MRPNRGNIFYYIALLFILPSGIYAQMNIRLDIQEDSVAVGRPFTAHLIASYSGKGELIFPDSADIPDVFEWVSSEPTENNTTEHSLNGKKSILLRTFNINKKQFLKLPVKVVNGNDTLIFYSPEDSFSLALRIQHLSDTLTYKQHNDLLPLQVPINYSRIFLITLISLLLLGLLILILRNPFIKMLRKRKISKHWTKIKYRIESLDPLAQDEFIYQLNLISKRYISESLNIHMECLTYTELKNTDIKYFEGKPEDKTLIEQMSLYANQILYAGDRIDTDNLIKIKISVIDYLYRQYKTRLKEVQI